MKNLLKKPSANFSVDPKGRFQKFGLIENPFPSEPAVNKSSTDKRMNGDIFEMEIRRKENEHIKKAFLIEPQNNPNHLRLGYITDSSYIGRGNGKTTFIVNLRNEINRDFCLDISGGKNKCFSLIISPEPGGRTKTFPSFVDLFVKSLFEMQIIRTCLATLTAKAIANLYSEDDLNSSLENETRWEDCLTSEEWIEKSPFDFNKISRDIADNEHFQNLPADFPTMRGGQFTLMPEFILEKHFMEYYFDVLKKKEDKIEFAFSHLIKLFQAADFNGAYIFVDDFERIPDFQSTRQKKDFALELRSCLFDGMFLNSKLGFYNFLLVLHAGVTRLISDSWAESGMENRAPLSAAIDSKHIINFEKLSRDNVLLLLKKYLNEYRTENFKTGAELFPFEEDAVGIISEKSEYNAAKILKMAYELLDKASEEADVKIIDKKFVVEKITGKEKENEKKSPNIKDADSTDLN